MMKKTSILVLLSFSVIVLSLSSCKKTELNNSNTQSITTNKNFDYKTEKKVIYKVSLKSMVLDSKYRIDFYKSYDKKAEGLMMTRFATGGNMVSGEMNVPAYLTDLYIQVTAGDGSVFMKKVAFQGNNLVTDLGTASIAGKKLTMTSPGCGSGCDVSYTNYSSNLVITSSYAGNIFCFDGMNMSNKHLNVNKDNVEIRICGTANIQGLTLKSNSKLVINDGADVTISNFSDNGATIEIYDAHVTLNSNFTPNGTVTNNGDLTVNGDLNVNNKTGDLTNNGSILVNGNFDNDNKLTNNDSIYVTGHLHFNGSTETYNHCFIYTEDRLAINSYLENYGYIGAALKVSMSGQSQTEMYDGAMIHGLDGIFLDGDAHGNGTTSILKTSGYSHINGGANLTGNIEFCDADGLEVNNGNVASPAAVACNVYIPVTSCNPEGNGTPTCTDSDNDGVCDVNDCEPNDPTIAGCFCYPNCGEFATLSYEDRWPWAGDYDFNDLVLGYQYRMFTNADDKVVRIKAHFLIRAIGAKFKNGFGVQLNMVPSSVSSVTGQKYTEGYVVNSPNGTEAGQSKTVIVIFDNAHTAFSSTSGGTSYKNTLKALPYEQPDTFEVVINFADPQAISALGVAPYNPFMISNSNRGSEIHLPNHEPTDLMNDNLFGTYDDNSNPSLGIYYMSQNNLPWAINIPEKFDYPAETKSILDAYAHFADWANSNGVNYPDWYQDKPGYRDASKIY